MTAANTTIITAFEELGMSPEEIAEQEDLDVTSIKATLMQCSALYRRACRKGSDELNFTDDQLVNANATIAQLAAYSEDERVKLKAAMYIRDDKKGRLDAVSKLAGLNVNVLQFNEQMRRALDSIKQTKQIIDIN